MQPGLAPSYHLIQNAVFVRAARRGSKTAKKVKALPQGRVEDGLIRQYLNQKTADIFKTSFSFTNQSSRKKKGSLQTMK
jgi:hypothetical protein